VKQTSVLIATPSAARAENGARSASKFIRTAVQLCR
jgi:hypothetical protein